MSAAAPLGLLVAAVLMLASLPAASAPPRLHAEPAEATAGYFVLDWRSDELGVFELREQVDGVAERTVYQGADTARLISGKADGRYRYQVRRRGEDVWSEPVDVRVEHHSLARALGFFLVGALVFIATTVLVLRGARGVRET